MKNKMLIVDDAEEICFAISEFFKLKGWDVDEAYNVEKALEFIREKKYDIILIDYNMPHINGMVGTRLIRQLDKEVIIVALTILGEEDVADGFFQSGANDFAIKPIKMLDLYFRINSHLKNKSNNIKEEIEIKIDFPKGIDKNTYELIERSLIERSEYIGVEEIAIITGIASKTVNRYLNFMQEIGVINVNLIYGKIGRPKKEYKWIK